MKKCPTSEANCDDNKREGELCTCVTSDCAQSKRCKHQGGTCTEDCKIPFSLK